jgi:hypothetical protein
LRIAVRGREHQTGCSHYHPGQVPKLRHLKLSR